jgi:hypothetical protein
MFDYRHAFQLLLNSEQASARAEVHSKYRPRHARTGLIAGVRGGKFWRFRTSRFDCRLQSAEHTAIDYQLEQRYSVLNHSCPQQRRR